MSKQSWQDSIRSTMSRLKKDKSPLRLAFLGVGNEDCGDDAAGSIFARTLEPQCSRNPNCLVLEAGTAPENFTGPLRKFSPDLVLIVDIAQFGDTPGEIRRIECSEIGGMSASTHTLPLNIFACYLTEDLKCEVAFLGIEPLATSYGIPVSPIVKNAVATLRAYFINIISDYCNSRIPSVSQIETENTRKGNAPSSHYLRG